MIFWNIRTEGAALKMSYVFLLPLIKPDFALTRFDFGVPIHNSIAQAEMPFSDRAGQVRSSPFATAVSPCATLLTRAPTMINFPP